MNYKKQKLLKERMNYWELGFKEGSKVALEIIDSEIVMHEVSKKRFKIDLENTLREFIRLERLKQFTEEI